MPLSEGEQAVLRALARSTLGTVGKVDQREAASLDWFDRLGAEGRTKFVRNMKRINETPALLAEASPGLLRAVVNLAHTELGRVLEKFALRLHDKLEALAAEEKELGPAGPEGV